MRDITLILSLYFTLHVYNTATKHIFIRFMIYTQLIPHLDN